MSSNRIGRPSKLNQETWKLLEQALVAGNTIQDACYYADISDRTYYEWKERGERDQLDGRKTEYSQFYQRCQKAMHKAKPRLVMLVNKGAERDPRIALTILERRYPKEWSFKQSLEVSGEIEHNVSGNIDIRLLDLLEKYPEVKAEWLRLLVEDEDGDEG